MAVVISGPMAAEDHHTAGVSNVFGCVCMRVWVHARACWLTGEGEFRSGHQSEQRRADEDTFQTVWCNLRVRALSCSTRPLLSAVESWSLKARTATAGDGEDVQWFRKASWTLTAMGSVQSVGRGLACSATVTECAPWRFKPGSCLVGQARPPQRRQATSPNRHLGKRHIRKASTRRGAHFQATKE